VRQFLTLITSLNIVDSRPMVWGSSPWEEIIMVPRGMLHRRKGYGQPMQYIHVVYNVH